MLLLLLSFALFVIVLALPTIPSIFEVRKPKDDGRLHITEQYVRDPRFFGSSFRSKLKSFVEDARTSGYGRAALQMRTEEDVRWAADLNIPPEDRVRGIGIGERVTVGHHAGIRDAYGLHHLDVQFGVVARTLTSDETMHIGSDVQVLRWVDSEGDMTVDPDTDLGLSASGGARVQIADRVRFERIWGAPVSSHTDTNAPFELNDKHATIVNSETGREGKPVIVYGQTRVVSGTVLASHLKVHGDLLVEDNVTIGGNVIARGDVTFASGVAVAGHVFSEGDIRLGPRTRVSRPGVSKTVYGTGNVMLADDVEVYGWIVSENGGSTL